MKEKISLLALNCIRATDFVAIFTNIYFVEE